MNVAKILKLVLTVAQTIVTVQAVGKPIVDAIKKKPG